MTAIDFKTQQRIAKENELNYVQVGKPQKRIKSKTTFSSTKRARKMGKWESHNVPSLPHEPVITQPTKMGKDREIEVCLEQAYECGRLGHDKLHIKSMKYRLNLTQPSIKDQARVSKDEWDCKHGVSRKFCGQGCQPSPKHRHEYYYNGHDIGCAGCSEMRKPSPKCEIKGKHICVERTGSCEEAKTWEEDVALLVIDILKGVHKDGVYRFAKLNELISEEISKARDYGQALGLQAQIEAVKQAREEEQNKLYTVNSDDFYIKKKTGVSCNQSEPSKDVTEPYEISEKSLDKETQKWIKIAKQDLKQQLIKKVKEMKSTGIKDTHFTVYNLAFQQVIDIIEKS